MISTLPAKLNQHTITTEQETSPSTRRSDQLQSSILTVKDEIAKVEQQLAEQCIQLSAALDLKIEASAAISSSDRQDIIDQAKAINEQHIKLLTRYNDTKDAAMELLGIIAEHERKTIRNLMEERGIEDT